MLKADVHYQGEHVQIDFHDSWEEIGKACIKPVSYTHITLPTTERVYISVVAV